MDEARAELTLNRVLNKVPGYGGYRDKESRRDADRLVRARLVAELTQRAEKVERLAQAAADDRRFQDVSSFNSVAEAIRHLTNRVNTATYGYGGLFGSKDVDAAVLDQIRLFDESLFAGIDQIDAVLPRIEGPAGDSLADATAEVQRAVQQMTDRFDMRNRIVDSGTPAIPEQMGGVLAVLQTPEEQKAALAPPPAYDVHDRDALAILGDNFVVDARIDVESTDDNFRLFRLDAGADKWLFAPQNKGKPSALLTRATDAYSAGPPPTIGSDTFTVESSGHGSGEVVGAGGQTGRRPLSYTLLRGAGDNSRRAVVLQWGAEQQAFSGNDVHSEDIEIFGKPS